MNKKHMLGETVSQQNIGPSIKISSKVPQPQFQQLQTPNVRRENKIQFKVGPETPKYLGFISMNKSQ